MKIISGGIAIGVGGFLGAAAMAMSMTWWGMEPGQSGTGLMMMTGIVAGSCVGLTILETIRVIRNS